ncbi:MAG TPA: hypothetical protein VIU29_01540 [Candidatus Deferrimicrobiaceae bacterium]
MRICLARSGFALALLVLALGSMPGCLKLSDLSESERLFPDSALSGAVARATVRDVVEGKAGKGIEITANAIIPENPRTEQLKPTSLTILKRLKEKYPDATMIAVSIYDDERAMPLGMTVAKAAYRTGTVTVVGGLPTEAEVAAVNAKRAKGDRLGPFAQPREEDFNIVQKVFENAGGEPPSGDPASAGRVEGGTDAAAVKKAAAFFRIPVERVETARFNLSNWYGMHRDEKLFEKK